MNKTTIVIICINKKEEKLDPIDGGDNKSNIDNVFIEIAMNIFYDVNILSEDNKD